MLRLLLAFLVVLPLALARSEPRLFRPRIECKGMSHADVCVTSTAFGFTDGCNLMGCSGVGVGRTTLMLCQREEDLGESAQAPCNRVRHEASIARAEAEPPMFRPRIQCKGLSHAEVCTGGVFGFTDGCNLMGCAGIGFGRSTMMLCQQEEELGKRAEALCDIVRYQTAAARAKASASASAKSSA